MYVLSHPIGYPFNHPLSLLQALENRTLDSKREMDIMNALDEMKSLKSRQEKVDSNALLAALQRSADDDRAALVAEDEAAVRSCPQQQYFLYASVAACAASMCCCLESSQTAAPRLPPWATPWCSPIVSSSCDCPCWLLLPMSLPFILSSARKARSSVFACTKTGKMTLNHRVQVRAMLQQQQSFVKRLDDSNAPANSVAPAVEQSKAGELSYGLLRAMRPPFRYPALCSSGGWIGRGTVC